MTTSAQALVDSKAASKILAISERTLWGLAHGGQIPFVRVARRLIRFRPGDLAAYIEGQVSSTAPVACPGAGKPSQGATNG